MTFIAVRDVIACLPSHATSLPNLTGRGCSPEYAKFRILKIGPLLREIRLCEMTFLPHFVIVQFLFVSYLLSILGRDGIINIAPCQWGSHADSHPHKLMINYSMIIGV